MVKFHLSLDYNSQEVRHSAVQKCHITLGFRGHGVVIIDWGNLKEEWNAAELRLIGGTLDAFCLKKLFVSKDNILCKRDYAACGKYINLIESGQIRLVDLACLSLKL